MGIRLLRKKNYLILGMFIILITLTLSVMTSQAELFSGTRNAGVDPLFAILDSSVEEYGYTSHFAQAQGRWNNISSNVWLLQTTSYHDNVDGYFVDTSPVPGQLGTTTFHVNDSIYVVNPNISNWDYAAVRIFDNNLDSNQMTFEERVAVATHEIGHSLGLDHSGKVYLSIMTEEYYDGVPTSPTQYDKDELKRKWGE